MPVEIKELIVRAVVERPAGAAEAAGAGACGNLQGSAAAGDADKAMVEACVKQVLKVLRRSKER